MVFTLRWLRPPSELFPVCNPRSAADTRPSKIFSARYALENPGRKHEKFSPKKYPYDFIPWRVRSWVLFIKKDQKYSQEKKSNFFPAHPGPLPGPLPRTFFLSSRFGGVFAWLLFRRRGYFFYAGITLILLRGCILAVTSSEIRHQNSRLTSFQVSSKKCPIFFVCLIPSGEFILRGAYPPKKCRTGAFFSCPDTPKTHKNDSKMRQNQAKMRQNSTKTGGFGPSEAQNSPLQKFIRA